MCFVMLKLEASQILLQFLLDYPLAPKRLQVPTIHSIQALPLSFLICYFALMIDNHDALIARMFWPVYSMCTLMIDDHDALIARMFWPVYSMCTLMIDDHDALMLVCYVLTSVYIHVQQHLGFLLYCSCVVFWPVSIFMCHVQQHLCLYSCAATSVSIFMCSNICVYIHV